MSSPITRVTGTAQAAGASADDRTRKLQKAAGDFESILVKQILKEAKLCGAEKSNGYGDMAVDAMASAVQKGGGLGLAKQIEHAIHGSHAAPHGGLMTALQGAPSKL